MFNLSKATYTTYWKKIRKKAPRVPDLTCPAIDDVINQLEKLVGNELKDRKYKAMEKKLERLRRANEALRDSGKYWHAACKDAVRDLLGIRNMR